jgi:hypothetical protein
MIGQAGAGGVFYALIFSSPKKSEQIAENPHWF